MAAINGHSQTCLIENPAPGKWTIGLYKISDYSDKTLTAVTDTVTEPKRNRRARVRE